MSPDTLGSVPSDAGSRLVVVKAELAQVDLGQPGRVRWVGGLVPSLHAVLAHAHVSKERMKKNQKNRMLQKKKIYPIVYRL